MITNIIDNRTRKYRWKTVNAVVEPTHHDNRNGDADEAGANAEDLLCETLGGASLAEALAWAQGFEGEVTLFLYDEGDGFEDEDGGED